MNLSSEWQVTIRNPKPQAGTSFEDHEIDYLVYELYDITNGEVSVIDPNKTPVGSDGDLYKA